MKKYIPVLIAIAYSIISMAQEIPVPEEYFGFKPGTDKMLFTYEDLTGYLKKMEISPRIELREIGRSTLGKPMYIAFISSEANIQNLDKLREINEQLAINPELSEKSTNQYLKEGKVFVLFTMSMHSNEVGPSQAVPEIIYKLATTNNKELLGYLDEVVLMIVPCHNPDGMDMVVNNYNKYKNTKYEACRLPGVYHKYAGHDDNRDFITLNLAETKIISDIFTTTWFPQVMIEKHQMYTNGPRYFVPPVHDPIAVNIDQELWNWTWIFGSNLSKDMTANGLAGLTQHYLFDDYWPGSTETALWKNVIALLTECASAHYASPVYIEPNELKVRGKGLAEYKKSINMPMPWEGGWWRLSDIVTYEIESSVSMLKTAGLHKKEILELSHKLCVRETEKGKSSAPYYYIFPAKQHDQSELIALLELLHKHNIKTYILNKDIEIDNKVYHAGDFAVPLAQPFRAFIKEILESQTYPVRHYTPGGKIIRPYDITSWSLPLHRGVACDEINIKTDLNEVITEVEYPLPLKVDLPLECNVMILPSNDNKSYAAAFKAISKGVMIKQLTAATKINGNDIPAGSFIIEKTRKNMDAMKDLTDEISYLVTCADDVPSGIQTREVKIPRIGLIETIYHDMDAGWMRWLMDTYQIPFTVLKPQELKEEDWLKKYDVLIFPDTRKDILIDGKTQRYEGIYFMTDYIPSLKKGMEKEGLQNMMKFIDEGGKVISWGASTEIFMGEQTIKYAEDKEETFYFPVFDISRKLASDRLSVTGALLKIEVDNNFPLTWGMPPTTGIFSRGRPVFETSVPFFDMDRKVLGTYPEKDILLSGYAENEKVLAGKAALVWVKKGNGQLVLMGFDPQFRGSTQGTFKLLFNSILL
jgi:hypothetical protein